MIENIKDIILNHRLVIRTFPDYDGEDSFSGVIKQKQLTIVEAPMIEVQKINFTLNRPSQYYDWLVFTSKNGVKSWFSRFSKYEQQKIAVIGAPTAQALAKFGLMADFIGSGHSGVVFAQEFKRVLQGYEKLLLILGNLAPDKLMNNLLKGWGKDCNLDIDRVDVYETRMPLSINHVAINRIITNDYRVIAVSSPSAVHNLMHVLANRAKNLRFVSIGGVTSNAIRSYGYEPVAEAVEQSYASLADVC